MPIPPMGLFDASFLGLVPPLWRYVMNPYVDEVMTGKPVSKSHAKISKMIVDGSAYSMIALFSFLSYQTYVTAHQVA